MIIIIIHYSVFIIVVPRIWTPETPILLRARYRNAMRREVISMALPTVTGTLESFFLLLFFFSWFHLFSVVLYVFFHFWCLSFLGYA